MQSPLTTINENVPLNVGQVRYVFWVIQKHCSSVMEQIPKLGNKNHTFEVGIIQFGKFCIIGALNRQTKETRLKVKYAPSVYNSSMFEPILDEWLESGSSIITKHAGFSLCQHEVYYVPDNESFPLYAETISVYLKTLVDELFSEFSTADINTLMIQSYLDDIQWRQKYGKTPETAFLNLLNQMSLTKLGYDQLIAKNAFSYTNEKLKAAVEDMKQSEIPAANCVEQEEEVKIVVTRKRSMLIQQAAVETKKLKIDDPLPIPTVMKEHSETMSFMKESKKKAQNIAVNELVGKWLINQDFSQRNDCLWTLEKTNTKLLKPVMSDCLAFLKNSESKKQEILNNDSNQYVAVDELYFAELKPQDSSHLSSASVVYTYSCYSCDINICGNIQVIDHILEHAEEQQRNSSDHGKQFFCDKCFSEFISEEELENHITKVHVHVNSLSCLICSQLFPSSIDLCDHMKQMHVPCEMPYSCPACTYRSSIYKDVLSHFRTVHKNEPHLVCPYCLKMCSPISRMKQILNTNTFCKHIFQHRLKNANVKCPSCCLLFFTFKELYSHTLKDHVSFLNSEDALPFTPRNSSSVVVIKKPPQSITLHPATVFASAKLTELIQNICSSQQTQANSDVSNLFHPADPVVPEGIVQIVNENLSVPVKSTPVLLLPDTKPEISMNSKSKSVKYNVSSSLQCCECGSFIDEVHFYTRHSCYCKYSTYCAKAFIIHMIQKHSILKKRVTRTLTMTPARLRKKAFCSCSFSSSDGDALASHLKSCPGFIRTVDSEFSKPNKNDQFQIAQPNKFPDNKMKEAFELDVKGLEIMPFHSQVQSAYFESPHAVMDSTVASDNERISGVPPLNIVQHNRQDVPQYLSAVLTQPSFVSLNGQEYVSYAPSLEQQTNHPQSYSCLPIYQPIVQSLMMNPVYNSHPASPRFFPPQIVHQNYTMFEADVVSMKNGIMYIQDVPVSEGATTNPELLRQQIPQLFKQNFVMNNSMHQNVLKHPVQNNERASFTVTSLQQNGIAVNETSPTNPKLPYQILQPGSPRLSVSGSLPQNVLSRTLKYSQSRVQMPVSNDAVR